MLQEAGYTILPRPKQVSSGSIGSLTKNHRCIRSHHAPELWDLRFPNVRLQNQKLRNLRIENIRFQDLRLRDLRFQVLNYGRSRELGLRNQGSRNLGLWAPRARLRVPGTHVLSHKLSYGDNDCCSEIRLFCSE